MSYIKFQTTDDMTTNTSIRRRDGVRTMDLSQILLWQWLPAMYALTYLIVTVLSVSHVC